MQQAATTRMRARGAGLSTRAIGWLFITPTVLLLLAINIFPLIWTIDLSFTDFRSNQPGREIKDVGLRNYERILSDEDIWARMQTTAHFVVWSIGLEVVLGFALALLIQRQFKGHALWTTLILLPMMLSPAVVGIFWSYLLQPQAGIFNYIVNFFIDAGDFTMIGDVRLAPWAIIIVDVWMWTPYVMLICLAGLRAIPQYLYEAAEVDGASRLQAVLERDPADRAALPDAGRAVPRHRELQDVRHGGRVDRRAGRAPPPRSPRSR